MKKTPLQEINERFGSKEKLVAELKTMFDKGDLFVERLNADKGLKSVANAKLLKLHSVAAKVKEQFGTRTKLIDEVLAKQGRQKDADFKAKLEQWGLPRLFDYFNVISRKSK